MKLTPTKFYGAFHDGLLELPGHAFEAVGRTFVVHKNCPPFCEWEKGYSVSDQKTGFKVPIGETKNRLAAARMAIEALESKSADERERAYAKAAEIRAELKIIEE